MKNNIFIFCLFLYACISAQTYKPLLDNRNEWHLISCYEGDCIRDIYYTDGDTIVNGQTHKILDGYHYISRTFLLRENIPDKKVYLTTIIGNQIKEHLLYDFNLEEGDSINLFNPITPFPPDGGYFRVDSIRVKPVLQNQNSRFYYFSPTLANTESQGYFPVWVEGVGSLSIINAPGGNPDYDGVGKVSCFFKNNSLFYFDDEMTDECNSNMSVRFEEENHFDMQFAVNSDSKGILKTNKKVNKIEIYDLSGRKQLSKSVLNREMMEVDLTGINKGVYILLVYEAQTIHKISFILK